MVDFLSVIDVGKSVVRVVDLTVKTFQNNVFKPNTRTLYFCAYLIVRLILKLTGHS